MWVSAGSDIMTKIFPLERRYSNGTFSAEHLLLRDSEIKSRPNEAHFFPAGNDFWGVTKSRKY